MEDEKRLIDANALLAKMKKTSRYFDIKFDIEESPSVDAVEVVRCKDCKYRHNRVCAMPYAGMWVGVELKDDDFCSYGERKKNG